MEEEQGQRKKQRTSCEEPTELSPEEQCQLVRETLRKGQTAPESEVKEALGALVEIVTSFIPPPPSDLQSCLELTFERIEPGKCGELALKVWLSLAEHEQELLDGESIGLVANNLEKLLDCLFRALTHQMHEPYLLQEKDGEWNIATGAGACLSVVAELVEDQIIPFVYSFVKDHINSEDWRQREAALMAVGATTSGPTAQTLQRHFSLLLPDIIEKAKDENEDLMVRDSACSTLGLICETGHLEEKALTAIHAALLSVLQEIKDSQDKEILYANACWALSMVPETAQLLSPEKLKPFLRPTFEALLPLLRSSLTKHNKDFSITEIVTAFSNWLRCAAGDVGMVEDVFAQLLSFLESLVNTKTDGSEGREVETEGDCMSPSAALCSCILGCMEAELTLPPERSRKLVDVLLDAAKFEKTEQRCCCSEELLLCFGGLAARIEGEIENFMPDIVPLVEEALRGNDPTVPQSTVTTALAVVGDLARALNRNISPFLDRLLVPMLVILKQSDAPLLHAGALSTIGALSRASCDNVSKYLPTILTTLRDTCNVATSLAATLAAKNNDDDYDEDDPYSVSAAEKLTCLDFLQQSIFSCYTGIIRGLQKNDADSAEQLLTPYLNGLVQYICQLSEDATQTETVTKAAIKVLGDLVQLIGEPARCMFHSDATLMSYLHEHAESTDADLNYAASRTLRLVNNLEGSADVAGGL